MSPTTPNPTDIAALVSMLDNHCQCLAAFHPGEEPRRCTMCCAKDLIAEQAREIERLRALHELPPGFAIGDDATVELAVGLVSMRERAEAAERRGAEAEKMLNDADQLVDHFSRRANMTTAILPAYQRWHERIGQVFRARHAARATESKETGE